MSEEMEQPKSRGRKTSIKNTRNGVLTLGGMLQLGAGEVVELTADHKKNDRLMRKINRALETGVLVEV